MRFLVKHGADLDKNSSPASSRGLIPIGDVTALICAAKKGHIEILRYLVEQGADKDKANYFGTTALMAASSRGHFGVVKLLLEDGADINKVDFSGWTALMWASASFERHQGVVQYLVEQGADKEMADSRNSCGCTALIFAAMRGHFGVVKLLLEDGADVNKVDMMSGWTALHWAALCGHAEILSLLMAYGASLTARDNYGRLPIDMAANEAIRVLIHDEPSRRMGHGYKRAVIPDPDAEQTSNHPHVVGEGESSASTAAVKTAEELKYEEEVNEDSASSDEDEI